MLITILVNCISIYLSLHISLHFLFKNWYKFFKICSQDFLNGKLPIASEPQYFFQNFKQNKKGLVVIKTSHYTNQPIYVVSGNKVVNLVDYITDIQYDKERLSIKHNFRNNFFFLFF